MSKQSIGDKPIEPTPEQIEAQIKQQADSHKSIIKHAVCLKGVNGTIIGIVVESETLGKRVVKRFTHTALTEYGQVISYVTNEDVEVSVQDIGGKTLLTLPELNVTNEREHVEHTPEEWQEYEIRQQPDAREIIEYLKTEAGHVVVATKVESEMLGKRVVNQPQYYELYDAAKEKVIGHQRWSELVTVEDMTDDEPQREIVIIGRRERR